MLIFALLALIAGTLSITAGPAAGLISTKLATLIFGGLFFACLTTALARRA